MFFLMLLLAGGGWVLGIIGFFSARRALREVREVRQRFLAPIAPPIAPPVAPPIVAPVEDPAVPVAVPAPETEAAEAAPAFEELLATRWGVWIGAVALLFAGVFLVRYAVDQGLLGPGPRCVLAGLLGIALIVAAELLRRRGNDGARRLPDQAPRALAAGGVAVLFGAAYGVGPLYGLVAPLPAFGLLAVTGLAGLALSLRHGRLIGVVGLVGAFVTPALVATQDPSLPGLFAYLLVVSVVALAVMRQTAWTWLGWLVTGFACGWVLLSGAISGTMSGGPPSWPAALFVPAVAALQVFLLPPAALDHRVGRRLAWCPFAALGVTLLLLAAIGDSTWARIGVLLLSPIAVARGATETRQDRLPWLAAGLGVLTLLTWAVPAWHAQRTSIGNPLLDAVDALLPGPWAPEVIQPLLEAALALTLFHAMAGHLLERRAQGGVAQGGVAQGDAARRGLAWTALPAAVPVIVLAVTYAQVEVFVPRASWAAIALALAAWLTGAAWFASRSRQAAGAYAAGACAAITLCFAMLLTDAWLSLALALFLVPLAWIAERATLPALRRVALAVAALVLLRLLLNRYVLDYEFGRVPVFNLLLPTYGASAAAFAWAAWRFRRTADDLLVTVLESGAWALGTALVVLELRHWATGAPTGTSTGGTLGAFSFLEAGLQVSAIAILATAARSLAARAPRPVTAWAWRIEGGVALGSAALLLVLNPAVLDVAVDGVPILDGLLAAYLVPAMLATLALRTRPALPSRLRGALGLYAVLAVWLWLTLAIRRLAHGDALGLSAAPLWQGELWALSGAWLLYGAALMAGGILLDRRGLRLAALAVIAVTTGKVFLVDMDGLVGLARVLSFLGLGVSLIGLGAVHRRFVGRPARS